VDRTKLAILKFEFPGYPLVKIWTNDNQTYLSDLSSFSDIYCFPKNYTEWSQGFLEERNSMTWPTGFDVHINQIISHSSDDPKAKTA
jgi:hypothetical protein